MTSTTIAGVLAAAGTSELIEIELPIPPLAYGAIALVTFLVLLGITLSFKNMANRR